MSLLHFVIYIKHKMLHCKYTFFLLMVFVIVGMAKYLYFCNLKLGRSNDDSKDLSRKP